MKSIAVAHPKNLYEDKAKICLQTIITFTENIIKNPTEEKFKKIKDIIERGKHWFEVRKNN